VIGNALHLLFRAADQFTGFLLDFSADFLGLALHLVLVHDALLIKVRDEQIIRNGIFTNCTRANRTSAYARLKPAMAAVRAASLPGGNSA
jgi:hypothetical protein